MEQTTFLKQDIIRQIPPSWSQKPADSPYSLIDSENQQIRLATLAPGSYDDPLFVSLRIESLLRSEHPAYEALSYVWGKSVSPRKTRVDGIKVFIGVNLDCALRHLRYHDRPRTLWIDALCINQADVLERSYQVQLMGYIYSKAHTVVIWLGPAEIGDAKAMHNIKVSASSWDTQSREALTRICKRAWFSRVWVVQEIALASTDPLVHLGQHSLPWSQFYESIEKLNETTRSESPKSVSDYDLRLELWKVIGRALQLEDLRKHRPYSIFADVLAETAELEATDPRDKVYGILGVTMARSPKRFGIRSVPRTTPDYSKAVHEVFSETAFFLIKEDPARLFYQLPLHPLRKDDATGYTEVSGLPSWVIDLTISSQELGNEFALHYNRPFLLRPDHLSPIKTRKRNLASMARLGSDNTLLSVGRYIGTIVETSQDLLSISHEKHRAPNPVLLSASILHRIYHKMLRPRNIPFKSMFVALYDRGVNLKKHGKHGIDEKAYKQLEQLLTGLEVENAIRALTPSEFEVLRTFIITGRDIILFVTSEGHVGVSYHPDAINGILPGDVAVGLFGLNLPFILRPLPWPSKAYQMVNVASVGHHLCGHPSLENAARGTTEEDVWNNLEQFGLQEYAIQ